MPKLRETVAVVGVGSSEFERRSDRPLSLHTLDAIRNALADAGLSVDDVDGLATYPEIPVFGSPMVDGVDVVSVSLTARLLGRAKDLRWHTENHSLIPNTFIEAANAVAAGACDCAVVFRAMHNPGGRYNAFTSDRAMGLRQFTAPYGVHRGYQYYGAAYRRYMHKYGATREHMATLIVNNRERARDNPRAYFRDKPLTREDYLDARMLADPVSLLDCDLPVDGALALVLVRGDRAADLPSTPAFFGGYGQYAGGAGNMLSRENSLGPPLEHLQEGSKAIADQMWRDTGISPGDVDVAQLYDGYSFFVYWWLEACGFCGEGEAFEYIQDARIEPGGELPLNTFGGQLAEGRLHGMGHIAEAVLQAAGKAGPRQVDNVSVSLAAVGPLNDGSATLLFTREPLSNQ